MSLAPRHLEMPWPASECPLVSRVAPTGFLFPKARDADGLWGAACPGVHTEAMATSRDTQACPRQVPQSASATQTCVCVWHRLW